MNMVKKMIACGVLLVMTSSCGELESSSRACRLMPELESSAVALDRAFDDLAMVDASLLRSSLTVLRDTLSAMREDSPLEITESLEVLDRAYREVAQALANVDFDGRLAINDAASLNAIEGLKRSENLRASQRLERFVQDRCQRTFDAPVPPQFGGGTTLPIPIQIPEDTEEYPYVVNDEESALASYGYVLVADRELVVDESQATCIGRVVSDLSQNVVAPSDDDLARFVDVALQRCLPSEGTGKTTSTAVGD